MFNTVGQSHGLLSSMSPSITSVYSNDSNTAVPESVYTPPDSDEHASSKDSTHASIDTPARFPLSEPSHSVAKMTKVEQIEYEITWYKRKLELLGPTHSSSEGLEHSLLALQLQLCELKGKGSTKHTPIAHRNFKAQSQQPKLDNKDHGHSVKKEWSTVKVINGPGPDQTKHTTQADLSGPVDLNPKRTIDEYFGLDHGKNVRWAPSASMTTRKDLDEISQRARAPLAEVDEAVEDIDTAGSEPVIQDPRRGTWWQYILSKGVEPRSDAHYRRGDHVKEDSRAESDACDNIGKQYHSSASRGWTPKCSSDSCKSPVANPAPEDVHWGVAFPPCGGWNTTASPPHGGWNNATSHCDGWATASPPHGGWNNATSPPHGGWNTKASPPCDGWNNAAPGEPVGSSWEMNNDTANETKVPAETIYNVTYWATIESSDQTIHVPIDSNNVTGPEKTIIEGSTGMKKVWKWVQEKGLTGQVSLRDAFDLAQDMHGDDEKEMVDKRDVKRTLRARSSYGPFRPLFHRSRLPSWCPSLDETAWCGGCGSNLAFCACAKVPGWRT